MTLFGRAILMSSLVLAGTSMACGDEVAAMPDSGTPADMSLADSSATDLGARDSGTTDAGEYVPDWSCVGSVTWPAATTATISLTGQIFNAADDAPLAGVMGTVCPDRSDTSCADGVVAGTSMADGTITTSLDTGMSTGGNGFFGYFELEKDGYMDVVAFTYRPLAMELPEPPTERMFTPALISTIATSLGITVNDEFGIINVRVRDCAGEYASGVHVELAGKISGHTPFYAVGAGVVVGDAESETDASGVAGFVNVPEGAYSLNAVVDGNAVGAISVFVRADTMSHMYLGPTPL